MCLESIGIHGVLRRHKNLQVTEDRMKMRFEVKDIYGNTIMSGDAEAFVYDCEEMRKKLEEEIEAHLAGR